MQIKTTIKYHITLVRVATIKTKRKQEGRRKEGQKEGRKERKMEGMKAGRQQVLERIWRIVSGNINHTAIGKNYIKIPEKLKKELPYDPTI